MARVNWAPGLPPEIKAAVAPCLEEFQHMIPQWLSILTIQYHRTDGTAHNTTKEEYRNSHLTFEAAFLDQPKWKQREDILHEILHIVTDPLYTQAWNLKEALAAKTDVPKEYLAEQLRLSLERTITDLTTCVLNTMEIERAKIPVEPSRR